MSRNPDTYLLYEYTNKVPYWDNSQEINKNNSGLKGL